MPREKKDEILRARVEESLKRKFRRYCDKKKLSDAHVLREAVMEFLQNHPIEKEAA